MVVATLILKYHLVGFRACLVCYYVDLDTGKLHENTEFEQGVMQALKDEKSSQIEMLGLDGRTSGPG